MLSKFNVHHHPCRIVCINGTTIYYDQLSVLRSVPYTEMLQITDHPTVLHPLKNSWPLLKISQIYEYQGQ
jgi:hypothetical protein